MNGVVMGIVFSEEIYVAVPTGGEFVITDALDDVNISHEISPISIAVEGPSSIEIEVEIDEIVVEPEG